MWIASEVPLVGWRRLFDKQRVDFLCMLYQQCMFASFSQHSIKDRSHRSDKLSWEVRPCTQRPTSSNATGSTQRNNRTKVIKGLIRLALANAAWETGISYLVHPVSSGLGSLESARALCEQGKVDQLCAKCALECTVLSSVAKHSST